MVRTPVAAKVAWFGTYTVLNEATLLDFSRSASKPGDLPAPRSNPLLQCRS